MADRLDDFPKIPRRLERRNSRFADISASNASSRWIIRPTSQARSTKNKELLGLVASAVLRCDDCITYHLVRCGEDGWKREEVIDALNVALIVGGSITIPHVRRAFARMREIPDLKNA